MSNNVDPDQMPRSLMFDLVYSGLSVPIFCVIMVWKHDACY